MNESHNTCFQDQLRGKSDYIYSTETYSSKHIDHSVKEICHWEYIENILRKKQTKQNDSLIS